jgi:hypothetical protein
MTDNPYLDHVIAPWLGGPRFYYRPELSFSDRVCRDFLQFLEANVEVAPDLN